MQNLTVPTVNKRSLLYWQLLLTGFLILAEISFFIQCNQAYLSGFAEVSQQLKIPYEIIPAIVAFIIIQLLIHLIFTLGVWAHTLAGLNLLKIQKNQLNFAIGIWVLFLLTFLLANQVYVPNSKFAELTEYIFPTLQIAKNVLYLLLVIDFVLFALLLVNIRKKVFALILIIVSSFAYTFFKDAGKTYPNFAKPHIIIIGVDSLRPDFLSFFGAERTTPNLDKFLQTSVVFSEAVTPLARTFPSWVSILTGKHPYEIGVRSNLAQQDHLDLRSSLPSELKKAGYRTLFATDESRFSNIDLNFGFDEVIVPPMGLNDFLIGGLNDFPLSNLLINTRLGSWIFPYSYANRGVFFTYKPDSFLQRVRAKLEQNIDQPLFLAVHFCLPHFPYLWEKKENGKSPVQRYQASVQGVDKQIKSFMDMLEQLNLLNNAIVVLLSDHGEALELRGDRITEASLYQENKKPPRFYPPSLDQEEFDQSAGHGTDVLGLTQYHTLLAFKIYGGVSPPKIITGAVSLTQIKNTLLELISGKENLSSLATYIKTGNQKTPAQHIFLESDFSPESIRTIYPKMDKVMLDGIQLFEIKAHTTRLVLKPAMEKMVIESKQYADIYGDWMLALYPINKNMNRIILVNLRSGAWTDNLNSSFAFASPAREMLIALRGFYGSEIKSVSE